MTQHIHLSDRALISISGVDAANLLQGLISKNSQNITPGTVVWALLLNPQGRWLHDFFVLRTKDGFILECEKDRRDDLVKKLNLYRLRCKVTIKHDDNLVSLIIDPDDSDLKIGQAKTINHNAVIFIDPRLPTIGLRCWGVEVDGQADRNIYDRRTMQAGLTDSSNDLIAGKSLPLDYNFDALGAIDWDKGCYIGQEVTARVHYRGLVRKRLLPVTIDGPTPEAGATITLSGHKIGTMGRSLEPDGLAIVSIEQTLAAIQSGQTLHCSNAQLTPRLPDWLQSYLDKKG